jgi:hypothetical protein
MAVSSPPVFVINLASSICPLPRRRPSRLDDRDGREAGIPESPRNGRFRPEPTSGAASQILTPRCERSVFALSLGFESALLFEETHDALCCVIPAKAGIQHAKGASADEPGLPLSRE